MEKTIKINKAIPQQESEKARIKQITLTKYHSIEYLKKRKEQLNEEKVVFILPNGKGISL